MKTARYGFGVSAVASIGLLVVYAIGGHTALEGILLGTALGGLGVALVSWATTLPSGDAVEERHPLESTPEERTALDLDVVTGVDSLTRRSMLRWAGAAIAALGTALIFPIRSLGPSPGDDLRVSGWSRGARLVDAAGRPIGAEDLDIDGVATVFPENAVGSASAQTLLIRVDPKLLDLTPDEAAGTVDGYVAYSKVCTHAGCPVGLFEQVTKQLLCPCHQSTFDVLTGAVPVFGPATRPLPQLPIGLDADGLFVALDDYPEPIGPGFWNRERNA